MSNKFQVDPRLPISNDDKIAPLNRRLYELFRQIAIAHNGSYYWETEGTAAPSSGTWVQGDKCKNTSPSEAGTAGSKFVVTGWICTVSGSPGTWLPMRSLTGN